MTVRSRDPELLTDAMLGGDRVGLARLITLIENRSIDTAATMSRIYAHCGNAATIVTLV